MWRAARLSQYSNAVWRWETRRTRSKYLSQVSSKYVEALERYSASTEERDTIDYLLDFQEINTWVSKKYAIPGNRMTCVKTWSSIRITLGLELKLRWIWEQDILSRCFFDVLKYLSPSKCCFDVLKYFMSCNQMWSHGMIHKLTKELDIIMYIRPTDC